MGGYKVFGIIEGKTMLCSRRQDPTHWNVEEMDRGGIDQKGGPGNECARMACKRGPAVGYNRSTGLWYCLECSHILNDANKHNAMELFGGNLVVLPLTGFKYNV